MDIIGLTEIKRSLRTRDPAAARIARRHYDLEVEQRFAAARARLPLDLPAKLRAKLRRNASKETLSADDRAYMLARVEHRLLARDDDVRASSTAEDGEQWHQYLDLSAEELALAREFNRSIAPRFRLLLEGDLDAAGLKLDPLSADYASLARDYNRVIAETLEKIGQRGGGRKFAPTPRHRHRREPRSSLEAALIPPRRTSDRYWCSGKQSISLPTSPLQRPCSLLSNP